MSYLALVVVGGGRMALLSMVVSWSPELCLTICRCGWIPLLRWQRSNWTHACDSVVEELLEFQPADTSAQVIAKASWQYFLYIILSCHLAVVKLLLFYASNWFQRAKIASPPFIGGVECFIGKNAPFRFQRASSVFEGNCCRIFNACIC